MGDDKSEKRPALGNITNQLGKRGYSLISRSPASKSKSENTQIGDDTDSDSSFWKQVSFVVEKLEKERSSGNPAKCPKIANEVGLSPLKGGKTYRLHNTSGSARMGLSNVVGDPKEPCSSALDSIDLDAVVNVGDSGVKEGCDSGDKVGESSKGPEKGCVEGGNECQGEVTREISDTKNAGVDLGATSNPELVVSSRLNKFAEMRGFGGNECQGEEIREISDTKNAGVDRGATSNPELVVSSRLDKFAEMRGFGLERCTALKEDGGCNLGAGMDLLKNCSCSFCTKAAYIWADLHYQDAKGRISAIEKSQKEASNLAQKYSAENEMGRHAQGNSTDAAQLDTDLMSHWRSLFLHVEDIFVAEASQLQNNFLALKDLREDFKMNLEMINGPSDVQQCSSDASDHTIV